MYSGLCLKSLGKTNVSITTSLVIFFFFSYYPRLCMWAKVKEYITGVFAKFLSGNYFLITNCPLNFFPLDYSVEDSTWIVNN